MKKITLKKNIYVKIFRCLLFLIIPMYLATAAFTIRSTEGPFYYFHLDHTYMDLLGSLNLACGMLPTDKIYPSAPTYISGAVIIHFIHFLTNQKDIVENVVKNPEMFITAMTLFWSLINITALFLAAVLIYRWTKNILLAMTLQLSFLIADFIIYYSLTFIVAESGIALASTALASALIFLALKNQYTKSIKMAVLMGAIIAFGSSSKISFMPLAIIPFLSLDGIKRKSIYITSCIFFFLLLMLPYLQIWTDIPRDMIEMAFSSNGRFSIRSKGSNQIFKNFYDLLTMYRAVHISLLCGAAAVLASVIWGFIAKWKGNYVPVKILIATMIGQIATIFIVSGRPTFYYTLAAAMLAPVTFILTYITIISVLNIRRTFYSTILSIVTFCLAFYIASDTINKKIRKYTSTTENIETIEHLFQYEMNDYVRILSWGSVGKIAAISFGNDWTRRRHNERLKEIYPDAYYYKPNHKKYVKWLEKITLPEIAKENHKIALKMRPKRQWLPDGEWHEVTPGMSGKETIYTLVQTVLGTPNGKKAMDGYTQLKYAMPLKIPVEKAVTDIPFMDKKQVPRKNEWVSG